MILSTQSGNTANRFGEKTAIQMIAMAGFDAIDFSMSVLQEDTIFKNDDYKNHAVNLRKTAEDCGVFFNQLHTPFPTYRKGHDEYNTVVFDKILRSLEVASILGVDTVIIHPIDVAPDDNFKFNVDFYNGLMPYARDLGLRIALENLWGSKDGVKYANICSTPDEFNRCLDALDRKYFVGCLDIGHCGLVGENAADMIRAMGHDRIKALHVHDNDNDDDSHTFPFSGRLDWVGITQALADIDYDGVFTFEADAYYRNLPIALHATSLKYLHDIGRQLIKMIESAKQKS